MTTRSDQLANSPHDVVRHRIGWLALILVPLLVLSIGLLLFQQVNSANRLRDAERASQERRALIMRVLSDHQDIESGGRGYIITGQEKFLEPYEKGRHDLRNTFETLERAYSASAQQLAELKEIEAWSSRQQEFARTAIMHRRSGNLGAAAHMVQSGRGKGMMDALRAHIDVLLGHELSNLEDVSRKSERAITGYRWAAFGLLGTVFILLLVASLAMLRALEARDHSLIDLEDTSRRRKAVLDGAMDAILILNPSGTIEDLNITAERMFGHSRQELLRRDAGMLFAADSPIGTVASSLRAMNLRENEPGRLQEILARRKDSVTFPADVAVTVVQLVEGLRYVAVVRDISERHRVERMKAEFVSTVSHELRTPLTSIAGSLALLAGGAAGDLAPKVERLITIAKNNADRLVRLINDILDIQKIELGSMRFDNQPLSLGDALAEIVEANRGFGASYNVSIEFVPPIEPAMVKADRDRIEQVFTNLIANAVKFSPSGDSIQVSVKSSANRHRVVVADHGPGIPEQFKKSIFDKFVQVDSSDNRQKGGTGLGLSIVQEIVARLGGEVSFESTPGCGTRFHVDLPALSEPVTVPAPDSRAAILICGAEPSEAVVGELIKAGYRPLTANDFDSAAMQIAQTPFAVIALDMNMPGDGSARIIRAARSSIANSNAAIIAADENVGAQGLQVDAAVILDWLQKPFHIAELLSRIEKAIGERSAGRWNILHVEDDPDVLHLVAAALEDKADVTSIGSLAEGRTALASGRYDLVILDLTLNDGCGMELVSDLRRAGETPTPVIIYSAEDVDPKAAEVVDAFVTKARTPIGDLVAIVGNLVSQRKGAEF